MIWYVAHSGVWGALVAVVLFWAITRYMSVEDNEDQLVEAETRSALLVDLMRKQEIHAEQLLVDFRQIKAANHLVESVNRALSKEG